MNINEFRVGPALSTSFSVWFKNLLPFTLLALVIYVPVAVGFKFYFDEQMTADELEFGIYATMAAFALLGYFITGVICYGTFQQLRGRHAGLGEAFAQGIRRLPAVLAVGVVTYIVTQGPSLLLDFIGSSSPALGGVLGLVGSIITIVLSMMMFVTIPVAVVERPGVFGALTRSKDLTDGCKGRIFGAYILLMILMGIVGFILYKILLGDALTADAVWNFLYGVFGLAVLGSTLMAVVSAVVYHDLRQAKEGVGIEELAKVFD